jgi:dienelactone hydrolase
MHVLIALLLALLLPAAHADSGPVTYSVGDEQFEGYFADAAGARGLVLLVHDWDGLTDYELQRAEMLRELGYDVFAADLFGAGVRPTEDRDKRQHTGALYADRARLRALMQGALDAAIAQGASADRIVAMGYCFGGAAVLEFARAGAPLDGFASFHGGLATPEGQDYSRTKGRVMVYHGSADSAISMQDFAALADALESAGVGHEMTTYGGAEHAFTVFGGDRYQALADRLSWASFTRFLAEVTQPAGVEPEGVQAPPPPRQP